MEKTGPKVGESSMLLGLFKVSHLSSICLGAGVGGWMLRGVRLGGC